jgi:hypothetical protein
MRENILRFLLAIAFILILSCAATPPFALSANAATPSDGTALKMQALVMTNPAEAIVDRTFWRGAIPICLLRVGLGLLRLVPQRNTDRRNAK